MTETVSAAKPVALDQIRTPAKAGGPLDHPVLPAILARLGVGLLTRPLRLGRTVVVARHRQVAEVLARDTDFGIGPVNAGRMAAVNGPFVLGLDRGEQLTIEQGALYAALAAVDMDALGAAAARDAERLLGAAGRSVDVVGGYARRVAGATAQRLFGVSGPDEETFLEVARAIFAHTFLNLFNDKAVEARALRAAPLMRAWLADEIARRRSAGVTGDDLMGGLMRQPALDDDAVRRTLGGMLVGSIDTTASAFAKIVYVLGRDPALETRARADIGDAARLRGWCWEALRGWPHNPLVLREALLDTTIAGVAVPKGARVFSWTQAAMLDAEAFPEPGELRPDRSAADYFHFGGGVHVCAGRTLNAVQLPVLLAPLLQRGLIHAGPIAWAGPFPDHMTVQLGTSR